MKILIVNTVPKNIGDLALVEGAANTLREAIPSAKISFLTTDMAAAQRLSSSNIERDYQSALAQDRGKGNPVRLSLAIIRRIPIHIVRATCYRLVETVFGNRLKKSFALLDESDIVLAAPGGYLHDYYVTEHLIQFYRHVIARNKRLVMLPQSVGPFDRKSLVEDLKHSVDSELVVINARGETSYQLLRKLELKHTTIKKNQDLGFLWRRPWPEKPKREEGHTKTIALCFREWVHGIYSVEEIVKDGVKLVAALAEKNCRVLFLSTCQGDELYDDDSAMAVEIVKALPEELKEKVEVNRQAWTSVDQLMDAYGSCDAYIGMRLHGCLLAMGSGLPAFGLGYEPKTREIYSSVGLEAFQCEFDKGYSAWGGKVISFIENLDENYPIFNKASKKGYEQAREFLSSIQGK